MQAILVNYNYDPTWLKDSDLEVTMYDRSDDKIERDLTEYGKVIKTPNLGDVDADKLGHLIEHYDNLPEVFLWAKTNIFKYVEPEYLKKALATNTFAPLLKFDHHTYSDQYGVVNRYAGPIYEERADDWLANNQDLAHKGINWSSWCDHFGLPKTQFIPFAPGGNYILTRDRVHKYSRDLYQEMRDTMMYAQHPVEAHYAERSYYLLWR